MNHPPAQIIRQLIQSANRYDPAPEERQAAQQRHSIRSNAEMDLWELGVQDGLTLAARLLCGASAGYYDSGPAVWVQGHQWTREAQQGRRVLDLDKGTLCARCERDRGRRRTQQP